MPAADMLHSSGGLHENSHILISMTEKLQWYMQAVKCLPCLLVAATEHNTSHSNDDPIPEIATTAIQVTQFTKLRASAAVLKQQQQ